MKNLAGVTVFLTVLGALNLGLVGLGGLLGTNLDVLNMLLGSWPTLEMIVFVLIGLSALMVGYAHFVSKECRMH